MPAALLTAQHVYELVPLGSLIRFSDGTVEPPAPTPAQERRLGLG